LKTADFDYELPENLIAQIPIEPRDAARLLVFNRNTSEIHHAIFNEIGGFLKAGDLLVLNKTRVIPARLFAWKIPSGGKVEILLLKGVDEFTWEALVGGKGLIPGKELTLEQGIEAEIIADLGGARRKIRFNEPVTSFVNSIGKTPLPPYIHTTLSNPERYQTIYAQDTGSAAAPTAGLHFTHNLIASLKESGIVFTQVTLHVGLDTFAPVTEDDPRRHKIHTEWCQLPEETAKAINRAKSIGGKVIAVGTTSVRTLESAGLQASLKGQTGVIPIEGPTNLYILPGFNFSIVDGMITNFHLPKSTLIMLVSAFVGYEDLKKAYGVAIENHYRFYSFGDAMLIL
jgi:S-adenosylmethionine:tRNA ribosyltransferase-isomerase